MTRVMENSRGDGMVPDGAERGIGRRALRKAVRDACHVYRYRDLEQNL